MQQKDLKHPTPQAVPAGKRAKYEPPRIHTLSSDELLAEIGPAQGYSGGLPGTPGGGGL